MSILCMIFLISHIMFYLDWYLPVRRRWCCLNLVPYLWELVIKCISTFRRFTFFGNVLNEFLVALKNVSWKLVSHERKLIRKILSKLFEKWIDLNEIFLPETCNILLLLLDLRSKKDEDLSKNLVIMRELDHDRTEWAECHFNRKW